MKFIDVPHEMEIARKHNINVIYFCGTRRIGKTFGVLDWLHDRIDDGDNKVCFLYRTYKAIDDVIAEGTFFDKVNQIKGRRYSFGVGYDIIRQDEDKEKRVGTFESIGAAAAIKNKGYSGYRYFVVDETQPEDGRYLPNECELLASIIESMGREYVEHNEWFLILMSNNASNIDLYTTNFSLRPFQPHRYQVNKTAGVMKCVYDRKEEETAAIRLYSLFPKYGKRAAQNAVTVYSNVTTAPRPRHLRPFSTWYLRDVYLYIDTDDDGNFHTICRNKPRTGTIFSVLPDETGGKPMLYTFRGLMAFSSAYHRGKVYAKNDGEREKVAAFLKTAKI